MLKQDIMLFFKKKDEEDFKKKNEELERRVLHRMRDNNALSPDEYLEKHPHMKRRIKKQLLKLFKLDISELREANCHGTTLFLLRKERKLKYVKPSKMKKIILKSFNRILKPEEGCVFLLVKKKRHVYKEASIEDPDSEVIHSGIVLEEKNNPLVLSKYSVEGCFYVNPLRSVIKHFIGGKLYFYKEK